MNQPEAAGVPEPGISTASENVPVLATQGLCVTLGGTRILHEVTLEIPASTISGIIGPNGAGKSTLLNAITGLVPVASGEIYLLGRRVTGTPSHKMAARGLGRSFQGVQFVRGMSALENVMAGDHLHNRTGLVGSMLSSRRSRRLDEECRERSLEALRIVGVEQVADRTIGELPFGVQKRVDIARAIISRPACLLLDEPLAGLSAVEKLDVAEMVRGLIRLGGLSVVLVEHDMRLVNYLCSYIVVLDAGEVLGDGDPAEVLARPEVMAAYTGGRTGSDGHADEARHDAETGTSD